MTQKILSQVDDIFDEYDQLLRLRIQEMDELSSTIKYMQKKLKESAILPYSYCIPESTTELIWDGKKIIYHDTLHHKPLIETKIQIRFSIKNHIEDFLRTGIEKCQR